MSPNQFMAALHHHHAGRLQAAEEIYSRILESDPKNAQALHLLGVIAIQTGRHKEAIARIAAAIQLQDDVPEFHNNLGEAYRALGRDAEAAACYRRALELKPDYAEAHINLGNALGAMSPEAVACFERALLLRPDLAEVHNNLGNVLNSQGRHAEAIACFQRALAIAPDFTPAHNNLGNAFKESGRISQAIASYTRALELNPDLLWTNYNLGEALRDAGRLHEATLAYRAALKIDPHFVPAHSGLLYTLHFCPEQDAKSLYDAHRLWNKLHAAPHAQKISPHANDPSPQRRLRVGYVSTDFGFHPVGWFMATLLEAHNRENVEVFLFPSVRASGPFADKFRKHAALWHNLFGLSDQQIADVIREHEIDILVDLTMHVANNHLLAFARKPAPVQVTYLAYCSTTGLETMDYRLTDPYLDPSNGAEKYYSEKSIYLPETYWCYRPPVETPPVARLPALSAGHVTFGCLNDFCKVTEPTLLTWGRILQSLPGSRLILHSHAGSHRDRVHKIFADFGVRPEQVTFVEKAPITEYFETYARIDIGLDPFPFGGGTTTCDALWMGVPVISLIGKTAVGRGGCSILSNIELESLLAHDVDEYVRLAAELAADLPRLSRLRAGLRERMKASPLMDAARFARHVEAAYREMWQRWCQTGAPPSHRSAL